MVGDILQPTHLLLVLIVALVVLGPKRLPEVGRALGDGIRDFRSAVSGEHHGDEDHRPQVVGELSPMPAEPDPDPDPEPPADTADLAPLGPAADSGPVEATHPDPAIRASTADAVRTEPLD